MAHHGKTPRSILDAPKLTPVWVIAHGHPNRAERRRRRIRGRGQNQPYRKQRESA